VNALSPEDLAEMIQVGGPNTLNGQTIDEHLDRQMPFPF
jgi:hypothetical protein